MGLRLPTPAGRGRGFLYLISGTLGAQVIALTTLPLISRVYSPEEFGRYALIVALAAAVAPAATLRFESAAMLPTSIEQVRALVWLCASAILTTSFLYAVGITIAAAIGVTVLAGDYSIAFWVALMVVLTGLFTLLSQISLRDAMFGLVARRTFLRSLATSVAQLLWGLVSPVSSGLVAGHSLGNSVGIGTMARRTRRMWRRPPRGQMLLAFREYWRFPAVFAPSGLLNALGLQAPLFFFVAVFGTAVGGQLGMAERIVAAPVALVGIAATQVFDTEMSQTIRDRTRVARSLYVAYSRRLALVGALIAIVGGVLGGITIPWILGEEWRLAGVLVQVLAVTAGVRLVASPTSRIIMLAQRSIANLVVDGTRVVLLVLAMFVCRLLEFGLVTSMWVVYSALSATYLVTWLYGFRIAVAIDASGSATRD